MSFSLSLLKGFTLIQIWEEVRLVKPTAFSAVPLVWNDIKHQFEQDLRKQLNDLPEELITQEKVEEIRLTCLDKYRATLGGRVRNIWIGGAAVSRELIDWLREVFRGALVSESYGSTEVGNISVNNKFLASTVKFEDWQVS